MDSSEHLLEQFKLPLKDGGVSPQKSPGKQTRISSKRFLMGPINLEWLKAAGRLEGKAFHVGIQLWYRAGLAKTLPRQKKAGEPFDFNLSLNAREWGFSESTASRGLQKLVSAGLVSVRKRRGGKGKITLHEAPQVEPLQSHKGQDRPPGSPPFFEKSAPLENTENEKIGPTGQGGADE